MRIALVDALADPLAGEVADATLSNRGHKVEHLRLTEERFAPNDGYFRVGTPGLDPLTTEVLRSELVLWLTQPRFGCWDPIAKSALDKCIGLLAPSIDRADDYHCHEQMRSPHWRVLALGTPDRAFEDLVWRNTSKMPGVEAYIRWIDPQATTFGLSSAIESLMTAERSIVPERSSAFLLRRLHPTRLERKRAVLWIGSDKPIGTSTSGSLGMALLSGLDSCGFDTSMLSLRHTQLREPDALLESLSDADLLVLSTPVYIDCLPALVVRALHDLVDAQRPKPPALVPIVQCGFPELTRNLPALRILECAANQANMRVAGHIALGGGGTIDGAHIEAGGRFGHLASCLERAADSLAESGLVPPSITDEIAKPHLPAEPYRAFGPLGWLGQANRHGKRLHQWDRPAAKA